MHSPSCVAQVVINEVCSSNNSLIEDEDEDARDWVELYNPTSTITDLSGFYLSDSKTDSTKWQFSGGNVPAGG